MIRKLRNQLGRWIAADRPTLAIESVPDVADVSSAMARAMLADLIQERRSERRWKRIKRTGIALLFLLSLGTYAWIYLVASGGSFFSTAEKGSLGVVRISGPIAAGRPASAAAVVPLLKEAFESDQVQAVVLQIDSPGGAPVESERIASFIAQARLMHPKPVYAVIETVGASAAYMIAVAADEIYAGRYSLVGSVGAMLNGWGFHRAMDRMGVERHVFASGNLKTMLDPFQPVTEAASTKAQGMVDAIGKIFTADVMNARGERLQLAADQLSSGEVWNGEEAKALGLIDGLGTLETLQARFENAPIKRFEPSQFPGVGRVVGRWSAEISSGVIEALEQKVLQWQ